MLQTVSNILQAFIPTINVDILLVLHIYILYPFMKLGELSNRKSNKTWELVQIMKPCKKKSCLKLKMRIYVVMHIAF